MRKGCERVVGSPGGWQWLQMRARIRTTVPCDAVEARPPGRAGALVKAVFNIYDMFVDSGDIVRQGAFSTWAPARFRGALAGSCRHGGMQTGRPDWSADCRCQANSKVCAQHVLGRGHAHIYATRPSKGHSPTCIYVYTYEYIYVYMMCCDATFISQRNVSIDPELN